MRFSLAAPDFAFCKSIFTQKHRENLDDNEEKTIFRIIIEQFIYCKLFIVS